MPDLVEIIGATATVEADGGSGLVEVETSTAVIEVDGGASIVEVIAPAPVVEVIGSTSTVVEIVAGGPVPDGDKGDISVSVDGTVWTIDADVLSAYGRTLTVAANAAAARTTLGLGSAALSAVSDFAAAVHGHVIGDTAGLQSVLDAKLDDSQASAFGLTLLDDADASAARGTLGLTRPFNPLDYGAPTDGTTAADTALAAMFAAAKATMSATYEDTGAYVAFPGYAFKVTQPINLTGWRTGKSNLIVYGCRLHADMTGGTVLDMTDSQFTKWDYLTLVTEPGAAPDFGIVNQRNSSGRVAMGHTINSLYMNGVFNKAAVYSYSSEGHAIDKAYIRNASRHPLAVCLHRTEDASTLAAPSDFASVATGSHSCNSIIVYRNTYRRNIEANWTITNISKTNPAVATYTLQSGGVDPVSGAEFSANILSGMTQANDLTFLVRNVNTIAKTMDLYYAKDVYVLPFDNQTGSFTVGQVLTGGTSGATAKIDAVDDSGTSGNLYIRLIGMERFEDNETITDPLGGSALANYPDVPVDATGWSTWSGSVTQTFYRSGPSVFVQGTEQFEARSYSVVTGADGFEFYGSDSIRESILDSHVEGYGIQSWIHFNTAGGNISVFDLTIEDQSSHVKGSFFRTSGPAANRVTIEGLKLRILAFHTTPDNGIFDQPSKYYIYDADITVPTRASFPNWRQFGHFDGTVRFLDSNETFTVPYRDNQIPLSVVFEDTATDYTFNTNKWGVFKGSHIDCNVATALDLRAGAIIFTSGADAAGTMAANGVSIVSPKSFQPSLHQVRLDFATNRSSTSNQASFIGFTDENTVLEFPAVLGAGDAITPTAGNFCGFLYDTAADTDAWACVARNNGGTSQIVMTDKVPGTTSGSYNIHSLRISTNQGVEYYIDGVLVASLSNAISPNLRICLAVAFFTRGAVTRYLRIPFIRAAQFGNW